jgi:hypothetical protein
MRTNEGMIRKSLPQLPKYELFTVLVRFSHKIDLRVETQAPLVAS